MAILMGELLALDVETATPGVYIPVADLTHYRAQTTQERQAYAVFQGAPKSTYGAHVKTLTLDGVLNPTDAGQSRLRAVHALRTLVNVRVLPDGVNGFIASVRIPGLSHDATAEESSVQSVTVDCETVGEPTIVGTGILA